MGETGHRRTAGPTPPRRPSARFAFSVCRALRLPNRSRRITAAAVRLPSGPRASGGSGPMDPAGRKPAIVAEPTLGRHRLYRHRSPPKPGPTGVRSKQGPPASDRRPGFRRNGEPDFACAPDWPARSRRGPLQPPAMPGGPSLGGGAPRFGPSSRSFLPFRFFSFSLIEFPRQGSDPAQPSPSPLIRRLSVVYRAGGGGASRPGL